MGSITTQLFAAGAGGAALAAGFLMSPDAYLALIALLVVLAGGALALIVQLERPFLGFALLVFIAVAFPLEFPGPSAGMVSSPFPLAAFICGAWLLHLLLVQRLGAVDGSRVVFSALALVAVPLVAFVASQSSLFRSANAPVPVQVVELGLFILSPCLFLAVGHQITSLRQLKWLTWLLVAAGLVAAALQTIPGFTFVARMTTRPGSVGSLFWTWLVAVTAAQALFNRKLSPQVRLALAGVTLLVLYHGLFQVRSWASGWAPALVSLGVIVLFKVPRLAIGAGLVSVPVGLFLWDFVSTQLMADEEYSLMTRGEASRVLWHLVEQSPIIGSGPANYYYYTENFPILGWYVRFFSHNNYQDILLQTGVLGLLAFCWFAFEVFRLGLQLYRQVPPDGFARAYVIGAVGGLAGSLAAGMLGDWIIPFYYNAGILGFRSSLLFWVFLGGLLALKRHYVNAGVESQAGDAVLYRTYRPALEAP